MTLLLIHASLSAHQDFIKAQISVTNVMTHVEDAQRQALTLALLVTKDSV